MKSNRIRYQPASLTIERRKNAEKIWIYRWRESANGKSIHRKRIIGSKQDLPTRTAALKVVEALELDINADAVTASALTVRQLVEHYKEIELADGNAKTQRTKEVY